MRTRRSKFKLSTKAAQLKIRRKPRESESAEVRPAGEVLPAGEPFPAGEPLPAGELEVVAGKRLECGLETPRAD